jgi:hypothetical protein
MMRFGGHEVDESLYYHLQAGWRLDVSAVAELSTRDSDMYLKVLEYCFTTYPETRGRIGALMRVGPELMPRVFEAFEMACASQPRAAVAAYLSGALGSKDEENAPAALSTAFRMDSLSEKDENFMTLLTHPLMDPTVGDSQLLTQRHQVSYTYCLRVRMITEALCGPCRTTTTREEWSYARLWRPQVLQTAGGVHYQSSTAGR